jgi:hypothetical protein
LTPFEKALLIPIRGGFANHKPQIGGEVILTDPQAITYNGASKNLPRTGAGKNGTTYRTADGEFEIKISDLPVQRDGGIGRIVTLSRVLPDPTSSNVFDDYRTIRNSISLSYGFDPTRAEASVDIPLLRTALLAYVDSTLQGRIIAGEK